MTRLAGAIQAVRDAVATAAVLPIDTVADDDDLIDDVGLDEIERESLSLILEEVFAITVPDDLWSSPLYRTPASLAEWCIRRSDQASWFVSRERKAG